MTVKINEQLSLETKLPFLTIQNFHMVWEINQHGKLMIMGIAQSGSTGQSGILSDNQRDLKLVLSETGDILFNGRIATWDFIHSFGIIYIKAEVESASAQLDRKPLERVFQKVSQTYSEVVRDIVGGENGKVICTVGNAGLQRPFICYKETAWQFAKRLASHQKSFLVADVITNRPNMWFGLKAGKKIDENISSFRVQIKRDFTDKNATIKKQYFLDSRKNYSIGDWMLLSGKRCVIYKEEAHFERGELNFLYCLAEEKDLRTEPYYNEAIAGLGLRGVVRETEEENFRLRFDIDKKSEGYFFSWRPETGNALYAMPEIGANAYIYFPNHDEKNGLGIRCWEESPEDRTAENKYLKTADGAEVELEENSLNFKKNKEKAVLGDSSISINGSQIQIQANGKVKVKAKTIRLSANGEIRATTE